MIRVKFDPTQLTGDDRTWWDDWSARADKATRALVEARERGEPHEFNSKLWGELKEFLLKRVFHGKCAYCESKITTVAFGDAEHYRPKGKVTVREEGKESVVTWQGQPHPGYYWLAYDWRNLLPACQRCNSADGKMNQFPVQGEYRGNHAPPPTDPPSLDAVEAPLLLHPYVHNPSEHLKFGLAGVISSVSPLGERSIQVYDLKRDDLRVDRQAAQERAFSKWLFALGNGQPTAGALADFRAGKEPHSRAALEFIRLKLEEEEPQLDP